MKRAELWRSVKFLLFSCSAGLIELGSFALFNEVLHWPYWAAYLLALVMLRCYGISRATGTIILPFPAASQACVWGMRADPIVLGRFHRQGWSLGDSKGGPHPPLACFLCGVTAFRVETGALRSVAAQAHRLRIHFPVSPSQIRNTVSDLKGRMKKRTWSFRLQPETECSAFILTWYMVCRS